jgi:3-oxoacyl-[acyl-carrier protein] reductase
MNIADLKVVVTGAARGMGRYFTTQLLNGGASVTAVDMNEAGLEEIEPSGKGALYTRCCDVANEDHVIGTMAYGHEVMGGVNGLINCAGIFRDGLLIKRDRDTGELKTMSLEQWQTVIDVDLTGPFLCTREFSRRFIESGQDAGVIVNMSSVSRHGNPGQSNYSAAKAGLVADTKLWASELARYGIRVGAIAPGFIDTPILESMRPDVLESLVGKVPLRRVGTPQEIWLGVKFIFECDYFTGRCVDIDGGVLI